MKLSNACVCVYVCLCEVYLLHLCHIENVLQVAAPAKGTILQASGPVNSVNLANAGLKPGTYIIQQTSGVSQLQPTRLQNPDPQGTMLVYTSQTAPGKSLCYFEMIRFVSIFFWHARHIFEKNWTEIL